MLRGDNSLGRLVLVRRGVLRVEVIDLFNSYSIKYIVEVTIVI